MKVYLLHWCWEDYWGLFFISVYFTATDNWSLISWYHHLVQWSLCQEENNTTFSMQPMSRQKQSCGMWLLIRMRPFWSQLPQFHLLVIVIWWPDSRTRSPSQAFPWNTHHEEIDWKTLHQLYVVRSTKQETWETELSEIFLHTDGIGLWDNNILFRLAAGPWVHWYN